MWKNDETLEEKKRSFIFVICAYLDRLYLLYQSFFWTDAALIITIVAVIMLESKLPFFLDNAALVVTTVAVMELC